MELWEIIVLNVDFPLTHQSFLLHNSISQLFQEQELINMIAWINYSHNLMATGGLFSSHPSHQQKDVKCPDYQTGNRTEQLLNHCL